MAAKKKTEGGSATKKSSTKSKSTTAKSPATKKAPAKASAEKQSAPKTKSTAVKATPEKKKNKVTVPTRLSDLSLGKPSIVTSLLMSLKARAEEKSVDYVGVLFDEKFIPKAVEIEEEESVKAILARLDLNKPKKQVEAPTLSPENVNSGVKKSNVKEKPREDEFLKRPKPVYEEKDIVIPKGFAPEFAIGREDLPPTYNNSIFNERFGWKYGYPVTHGTAIELIDGARVGILAKIRLDDVWKKATKALKSGEELPVTKENFDKCLSAVKAYIGKAKRQSRDNDAPILVQDLFEIRELEYRRLMLPHASEFCKVIKIACEYDMRETEKLLSRWKKIKKYKHKVTLSYADAQLGLFSNGDVSLLSKLDIRYINDIKAHNIVEIKNLMLEADLSGLVENINAAYKEDKARRTDAKYRTYPFVFTFVSLISALFLIFRYQYTIIKDELGAQLLNNVFVVWGLGLLIFFIGLIRSPGRKKKYSNYKYFTKTVKRKTFNTALISLVAIVSAIVFFHRYDGYNNKVYYRFIDDETIAVAGLVNGDTSTLEIPEEIDGYKVVEIADRAFSGSNLSAVVVPTSVETVGRYAFSRCGALTDLTAKGGISGIKTVERGAFEKCGFESTEALLGVETLERDAFKGSKIKQISLPSVKTIEKGAFKNVETLTSVTLSAGLEAIPESCFEGCMYITELSGYSGVKSIAKRAFKGCMGISDINLDTVEVIGQDAFEGCISLTEIDISATAREIGKNAFKGCNNILVFETPFIGKSAEETAKYSFDYFINCNSLKKPFTVVLKGMTTIHSKAFEDCSSIVAVDFGDSVTRIEAGAFKNATSLASITLPAGLSTVEKEAFFGCTSLKVVEGLGNASYIEKSAFEACSALETVDLSSAVRIGEMAFKNCLYLSNIGNIENLSELGKSAFEYCISLDDVILPTSLTEISEAAFRHCTSLKSITLPTSMRKICKEAFAESGLFGVNFNHNLSEICESAFKGCYSLSSITIPASVKSLGKNAFADCHSLTRVEAPFLGMEAGSSKGSDRVFGNGSNVTAVIINGTGKLTEKDMKAFKDKLQSVEIGGSITEIDKRAFKEFDRLYSVTFGPSVKKIGNEAFYGCSGLGNVSLVDSGITEIGEKAFSKASLDTFTAGSALRTIGKEAFLSSGVETLDLSLAAISSVGKKLCYDCTSLRTVKLPSSLLEIGEAAFKNAYSLNIIAMDRVQVIGKEAFACTDFTSFYVPAGCKKLGEKAFADCERLYTLILSDSVTEIGKGLFAGCDELTELTIPFIGTTRDSAKKISELGYHSTLRTVTVTNAKKLGNEAFAGCSSLEMLDLNVGITEIGKDAISGCYSLYRVTLPEELSKYKYDFKGAELIYK